jgi:hypothetical protein
MHTYELKNNLLKKSYFACIEILPQELRERKRERERERGLRHSKYFAEDLHLAPSTHMAAHSCL